MKTICLSNWKKSGLKAYQIITKYARAAAEQSFQTQVEKGSEVAQIYQNTKYT